MKEDAAWSRKAWTAWLASLADPATSVEIDLAGVPARMRPPEDWRARDRLAKEHLLYLPLEGGLMVEIGGVARSLRPGDLFWVAPGTAFSCRRSGGGRRLLLLRARLRLSRDGKTLAAPRPWRVVRGAGAAGPWLEEAGVEVGRRGAWGAQRMRALAILFFSELARLDEEGEEKAGRLTATQRTALEKLVAEAPEARWTPAQLARAAGLSADYFARCFRRSYGRSPRRWILEQRIGRAAQRLLESERTIGEVAREFGYEDGFLFSRQFKAVTGRSPREFRRRG